MARRKPPNPSHVQGIRFPLHILERVLLYAATVHNSVSGAVVALVELALKIEEPRLGLTPKHAPPETLDRYDEGESPLLRVAETTEPPTRKKKRIASGARGGRRA